MKPVNLFGLGLIFFARFVQNLAKIHCLLDLSRPIERAHCKWKYFFRFEKLWLKFQAILSPPQTKNLATSLRLGIQGSCQSGCLSSPHHCQTSLGHPAWYVFNIARY